MNRVSVELGRQRSSAYKKLPGNMRCGGTNISSKKSSPTAVTVNYTMADDSKNEKILFMPNSEALLIRPKMISPLNGRNTIIRNSTESHQPHFLTSRFNPLSPFGVSELLTIDVDDTSAMANETIRGFQNIIDANAETDLLDHLELTLSC